MNFWIIALIIYIIAALVTLIPTLKAILKKVNLFPSGESFEESDFFSEKNRRRLISHYSRIHGTLVFWKNKAEQYKCFHYYCLLWTIPISILIPTLLQFVAEQPFAKIFLTVISLHSAILGALHKSLKIENNYKAFRQGESEFYDAYRQLLDDPLSFGDTEESQLKKYFTTVEQLRKNVRNLEIDNFPQINNDNDENK